MTLLLSGKLLNPRPLLGGHEVDPAEFKDDTSEFKGEIVTLEPMRANTSLRFAQSFARRSGDPYYNVVFRWSSPVEITVSLMVPVDLNVPDVNADGDALSITFECTEGNAMNGNKAVQISRWSHW